MSKKIKVILINLIGAIIGVSAVIFIEKISSFQTKLSEFKFSLLFDYDLFHYAFFILAAYFFFAGIISLRRKHPTEQQITDELFRVVFGYMISQAGLFLSVFQLANDVRQNYILGDIQVNIIYAQIVLYFATSLLTILSIIRYNKLFPNRKYNFWSIQPTQDLFQKMDEVEKHMTYRASHLAYNVSKGMLLLITLVIVLFFPLNFYTMTLLIAILLIWLVPASIYVLELRRIYKDK